MFEVRPATIGRRTLEVLLFDFDAYSRHVVIGGAQLPLANVDLSDRIDLWRALGPCSETVKDSSRLIAMSCEDLFRSSRFRTPNRSWAT